MKQETFDQACKVAQLKVTKSADVLTIKSVFNPLNKSSFGTIIFLALGISVGIITTQFAENILVIILLGILSISLSFIGSLSILSQMTDSIKISGGVLTLKKNLRLSVHKLSPDHKVKMNTKSERVKLKSQPGSGSDFQIIELYLTHGASEKMILEFQMDDKHAVLCNKLGNEISRLIKERLKSAE